LAGQIDRSDVQYMSKVAIARQRLWYGLGWPLTSVAAVHVHAAALNSSEELGKFISMVPCMQVCKTSRPMMRRLTSESMHTQAKGKSWVRMCQSCVRRVGHGRYALRWLTSLSVWRSPSCAALRNGWLWLDMLHHNDALTCARRAANRLV
jgi:hypothetical protein